MSKIRHPLGQYTVRLFGMVPTEDGCGFKREFKGTRTGDVVLEIDTDKLKSYAERAIHNKDGISKLANGAIQFRDLTRRT